MHPIPMTDTENAGSVPQFFTDARKSARCFEKTSKCSETGLTAPNLTSGRGRLRSQCTRSQITPIAAIADMTAANTFTPSITTTSSAQE